MKPEELINQFSKQLDQIMSGAEGMGAEVHQQLRSAMMSTFSKLDLVTRDEFDTQRAVLMRSREKIESLERQLIELEAAMAKN